MRCERSWVHATTGPAASYLDPGLLILVQRAPASPSRIAAACIPQVAPGIILPLLFDGLLRSTNSPASCRALQAPSNSAMHAEPAHRGNPRPRAAPATAVALQGRRILAWHLAGLASSSPLLSHAGPGSTMPPRVPANSRQEAGAAAAPSLRLQLVACPPSSPSTPRPMGAAPMHPWLISHRAGATCTINMRYSCPGCMHGSRGTAAAVCCQQHVCTARRASSVAPSDYFTLGWQRRPKGDGRAARRGSPLLPLSACSTSRRADQRALRAAKRAIRLKSREATLLALACAALRRAAPRQTH